MTAKKPITSDQRRQLRELLSSAAIFRMVKRIGLDGHGVQRLLARGGELMAYIEEGIRRFSSVLPDYDLARQILGDDFISPADVTSVRGLKYTPTQLRKLAESLPSEAVLLELKRDGYALMPAPPKPMSLLEIRALKAEIFYSQTTGWYSEAKQLFSRADKTTLGWLAIKKTVVTNSTSKVWKDQLPLISGNERVPNVAEFAWFLSTYLEVRGIRLFQNIYARTSSVGAGGYHVALGFFGGVLSVGDFWVGNVHSDLGLVSARKF